MAVLHRSRLHPLHSVEHSVAFAKATWNDRLFIVTFSCWKHGHERS